MDTITGYRKVLARKGLSQEQNQATGKIRTNNEKSESLLSSDQQEGRTTVFPHRMLDTQTASQADP